MSFYISHKGREGIILNIINSYAMVREGLQNIILSMIFIINFPFMNLMKRSPPVSHLVL